jgi:ketosteroid isomerase-like protein
MVSWLGKKILTFSMGRLSAGDPRPILLMDAGDMTMTFPGDNSWGGVVHGKAEHERWLRRFTKVGIRIWPDEVVLKGFPWKMTLCVRGRDYLRTADGETVYENRYVIWGHLVWGKVKEYEVYEDTETTAAFDRWLEAHEPALAA